LYYQLTAKSLFTPAISGGFQRLFDLKFQLGFRNYSNGPNLHLNIVLLKDFLELAIFILYLKTLKTPLDEF